MTPEKSMFDIDPYKRKTYSASTRFPLTAEGNDGDEVLVVYDSKYYICRKINNKWLKFEGVEV
jgi:hypothetical protein